MFSSGEAKEMGNIEENEFGFLYASLFVAMFIYCAGFCSGWMVRRSAISVVVHCGVQTEEEEPVRGEGMRRRGMHGKNIFVAVQSGECYHGSPDCFGLRKAIQVKELRTCKLCAT